MGINYSLLPCWGSIIHTHLQCLVLLVNKEDNCPIWWFVRFNVSFCDEFLKLNLDFLQFFMTHSILGLGKKCHFWYHLDCMVNSFFRGQLIKQLFECHIWEFIQDSLNTFQNTHQVGSFLWLKLVQHMHHTQHAITSHDSFSKVLTKH